MFSIEQTTARMAPVVNITVVQGHLASSAAVVRVRVGRAMTALFIRRVGVVGSPVVAVGVALWA
jgi:hypothetical protein